MGTLAGMGIILTSACSYFAILMYSNESIPLFMYIAACLMFVIGVFVDFSLIALAAIPNKQGEKFKYC